MTDDAEPQPGSDRALVLDLGGVVAQWVPGQRLAELGNLSDHRPEVVDRLVFESGFDDAGERGRFTLDEFVDELAGLLDLGRPVSDLHRAELQRAWAFAYELSPAVLRVAGRFPGPTALFTNNGPLLEACVGPGGQLGAVGSTFDHLLFSWRLGAVKRDPEAFELAAAALDLPPERIVYFDDSQANVDAGLAAGWDAHRYTTTLDLSAVLARLR